MSDSSPAACIRCGMQRLKCDQGRPCTNCKDHQSSSTCSYNWKLGPHIFRLFSNLSSIIRLEPSDIKSPSSGAFGCVYRAVAGKRLLAVKVLFHSRGLPPRALELSLREAWIWSRLSHPNIALFLGVANYAKICPGAAPQLCLVSEWRPKGNIMEFLAEHPSADRLSLVWDITKGVSYLHEFQGGPVIHGDMKGTNVLMEDYNGRPRACLTDFGLAHVFDNLSQTDTTSTSDKGNVRWLAFERLFPSKYHIAHWPLAKTTASDVFELMRTGLEIFTGAVPFKPLHDLELVCKLDDEECPERPECAWMDDTTWDLMTRSWSPTRESRPTANEIRDFFARKILSHWVHSSRHVDLKGIERILSDDDGPGVQGPHPGEADFLTEDAPPHVPTIVLASGHQERLQSSSSPVPRSFSLLANLAAVLPRSKWKTLVIQEDNDLKVIEWFKVLQRREPEWSLESLEVSVPYWSSTAIFNKVLIFVATFTSLKRLRIKAEFLGAEREHNFVDSDQVLGGLETLELVRPMAPDVLHLCKLYETSCLTRLALVDIPKEWSLDVCSRLCLPGSLSLNRIVHLALDPIPARAELTLNGLLHGLLRLTRLQLGCNPQDVPNFIEIMGEDTRLSTPQPFLPSLREVRLGGFRPMDILEVMERRMVRYQGVQKLLLHRHTIRGVERAENSLQVALSRLSFRKKAAEPVGEQNEVAVRLRTRLADAVSEVGWFSSYDLSAAWSDSFPEEGSFWVKNSLGTVNDLPVPVIGSGGNGEDAVLFWRVEKQFTWKMEKRSLWF